MLELFLIVGTILMLFVTLYIKSIYQIELWKTITTTVILTFVGVFGTQILFLIETGKWGGTSFFGAVFLTPVIMTFWALVIKSPIGAILDMCAPAECIMLALMKVRCLIYKCCGGRVIFSSKTCEVRFPSQIVEMITSIIIMVVLIKVIKKKNHENQIYAWYMILYGITRFILNILRDTKPFIWIIPAGNFWALISVILGILWLTLYDRYISRKYDNRE